MAGSDDSRSGNPYDDPPLQRNAYPVDVPKETTQCQTQRPHGFGVYVLPGPFEDARHNFVGINLSPTLSPNLTPLTASTCPNTGTCSSRNTPNQRVLSLAISSENRSRTPEIEKDVHLALGCTSAEKPRTAGSRTFTKVFKPRLLKTLSLPVTLTAYVGNRDDTLSSSKQRPLNSVQRSHSVPIFNNEVGGARNSDSGRGVFRVIVNTSRGLEDGIKAHSSSKNETELKDGDDECIAEEEALCRICLVELSAGSKTFKLECMCKGELALGHEDCVMQWFTLKGNRKCDICKHDVQNLPVTLQRFESRLARSRPYRAEALPRNEYGRSRSRAYQSSDQQDCMWLNFLILAVVNMIAYSCFFELILLEKDFQRIAITLPFSCISGFLAAVVSTKVVETKYVWIYAAIQFGFVVLFAYVFYLTFHVQPHVVAMFLGLGTTLIGRVVLGKVMDRLRALATESDQNQNRNQRRH